MCKQEEDFSDIVARVDSPQGGGDSLINRGGDARQKF